MPDADANNVAGKAAQRGGRRGFWIVVALFAASAAVNVWWMVHYRLPGPLWRMIQHTRESIPQIPLADGPAWQAPKPVLGFPAEPGNAASVSEWQSKCRAKLRELLGVTLPADAPPVRKVAEEPVGDVVRETLVLTMSDGLEVPGFLLRPKDAGRRPGVLVIPGHSRGIVATAGLIEDYQHANALALAQAGFIVLTLEVRGFGYLSALGPKAMAMDQAAYVAYCLSNGATAIGATVADAASGLGHLSSREGVDASRLGVVGFSSGGKAAIYLAALDPRASAVVASGCVESNEFNFRHSLHDSYEALPGMARWLAMSDCLGLIAPRPLLVHWGELDTRREDRCAAFNASSLAEFEAGQRVYRALGSPSAMESVVTPGLMHEFDPRAAIEFLRRRLLSPSS